MLAPLAIAAWKRAGSPSPIKLMCAKAARLIGVELHFLDEKQRTMKIFVISAHMPHSDEKTYTDEDYEDCITQLIGMMSLCDDDVIPFVGADLNARIGTRSQHDEMAAQIIGPHSLPETNNRGRLVLNRLLLPNNLKACATFFRKTSYSTWTCKTKKSGPQGVKIDDLLCRGKDMRSIVDCGTKQNRGVPSDHIAGLAKIRLLVGFKRKDNTLIPTMMNSDRTKESFPEKTVKKPRDLWEENPTADRMYNLRVQELIQAELMDSENDEKEILDLIKLTNILQEASKVYPEKKRTRNDWFTRCGERLIKLVDIRNEAELELAKERTEYAMLCCREARRKLKKATKDAKEDWLATQAQLLENMDDSPYSAWKAMENIMGGLNGHHKKLNGSKGMQRTDGSMASTDAEVAKIQAAYLGKEVFGIESPYDTEALNGIAQLPCADWIDTPYSLEELRAAVIKAKTRKAPGSNGVFVELFKKLDDKSLTVVLDSLNEYCSNPTFDSPDWHTVALKLLPKKGDLTLPTNWRPISLIDVLSKLLSSMMANRFNVHITKVGLQEQAGFMSNRGCVDATAALKITLQNITATGQEAYVLFVDIVKAFDSVNREMLWAILAKYGIPPATVATIKKMYTNIIVSVRVGKEKEEFTSRSGVKQGDNLAPILFLFVIQAAVESMQQDWPTRKPELEWSPNEFIPGKGLEYKGSLTQRSTKTKDNVKLDHNKSFYADDAAFIFLSFEDLITGTKHIRDHFQQFGLQVHLGTRSSGEPGAPKKDVKSKTEAMFFPPFSRRKEKLPADRLTGSYNVGNGRFVSFCPHFRYLGTNITPDLDDTFDIDTRITAATQAWHSMKSVLMNKNIDKDIRKKLYMAIPVNILLWGCDSWALSSSHLKKLAAFHNSCARRLCGITLWHCLHYGISTKDVLENRLKMLPIHQIVAIRQLRFLQNVAFQNSTRLTRKIMNSQAVRIEGVKLPKGDRISTQRAYKDVLIRAKLVGTKGGGSLAEWIPKLRSPGISAIIEQNLELPENSFCRGQKSKKTNLHVQKTQYNS